MYHPLMCGSRGGGRHSKFPLSSLRAARDVPVTPCQRSNLQISVSLDGPGGRERGFWRCASWRRSSSRCIALRQSEWALAWFYGSWQTHWPADFSFQPVKLKCETTGGGLVQSVSRWRGAPPSGGASHRHRDHGIHGCSGIHRHGGASAPKLH